MSVVNMIICNNTKYNYPRNRISILLIIHYKTKIVHNSKVPQLIQNFRNYAKFKFIVLRTYFYTKNIVQSRNFDIF